MKKTDIVDLDSDVRRMKVSIKNTFNGGGLLRGAI